MNTYLVLKYIASYLPLLPVLLVYYNKKSSYAYLLRLDDTFVSDLASRLPIHVGPVKEYNALLS